MPFSLALALMSWSRRGETHYKVSDIWGFIIKRMKKCLLSPVSAKSNPIKEKVLFRYDTLLQFVPLMKICQSNIPLKI